MQANYISHHCQIFQDNHLKCGLKCIFNGRTKGERSVEEWQKVDRIDYSPLLRSPCSPSQIHKYTNTQIHKYIALIISFTQFNLVTIISIVIIIESRRRKSGDLGNRFPPFWGKIRKSELICKNWWFSSKFGQKIELWAPQNSKKYPRKIRNNAPEFGRKSRFPVLINEKIKICMLFWNI